MAWEILVAVLGLVGTLGMWAGGLLAHRPVPSVVATNYTAQKVRYLQRN